MNESRQKIGKTEQDKERKNLLLEEYKIIVGDLHHIHNIHHSLLHYTFPFVVVVVALAAGVPSIIFLAISIAALVFVILLWLFYARLDYLLTLKFIRLVEIEKQLNFKCFSAVRDPPWQLERKKLIGKKLGQMRIYRANVILMILLLVAIIAYQLFFLSNKVVEKKAPVRQQSAEESSSLTGTAKAKSVKAKTITNFG